VFPGDILKTGNVQMFSISAPLHVSKQVAESQKLLALPPQPLNGNTSHRPVFGSKYHRTWWSI
jgi:hypothetical protein